MSTREEKKRSNMEEGGGGFPLIPGLPYDVALECLVRVPVSSHNAMIKVSKPWRNLLLERDSHFYTLRSQLGLLQPMIFLVPTSTEEERRVPSSFFRREATLCPHKSRIFVMGGLEDESTKRTNDFYIVDTLTRKIKKGPGMLFSTAAPAYGVLNDRLYVAGGFEDGDDIEDSKQWSTSVQCYDISSNTWRHISPLPFPIIPELFMVEFGLFIVIGFISDGLDRYDHSMFYSDETDSWAVYNNSQYEEKVLGLIESRARAAVNDHCSALTASTSFSGMLFLRATSDKDPARFLLNNMGDFGRLLQIRDKHYFPSLMPRDALPTITDIDGDGALRAMLMVMNETWIKTPVHSKWSDLAMLFYSICGELGICIPESIEFEFVVVCY